MSTPALPLTDGAPYPLQYYLNLVTSEHSKKPKFMATVAAAVQPFVDLQATFAAMIGIFNPNGVGDQLDKFGQWVGVTRDLVTPINGETTLGDSDFQTLIKLAIAQNHWDGTIPGAYNLWNAIFGPQGIGILIQDYQDMTMLIVFTGGVESVVTKALLSGGFFGLRPAGVMILGFFQPSVPDAPVFGFGAQNSTVSGFGTGAWIEPLVS
jgi:hypothetical protein